MLAGLGTGVRRSRVLVTLVVVLLGAVAAPARAQPPAPPAHTTGKATFGIGAADKEDLDGRPYLNYTLSKSSHDTDHVAVRNYGLRPITLTMYAAAATATPGGGIGFAPESHPGKDANRWITFRGGAHVVHVHLAGRQSRLLPISIAVPSYAQSGDHLAAVIASFQGLARTTNGKRVKLDQQVALRALFRVSGHVQALLSIENLHASYHGTLNPFGTGSATVTYTVRNAGNVLLSGKQQLNVTGLFGSTGSTSKLVQLPLMLPGARFPMRVEVHDVRPQLPMHARVTITPLGVAGAVNPGMQASSAATSFWAVPWTLLALIVVVIALVVGLVIRHRRRKAQLAELKAQARKAQPAAVGEA
jgi:hypothetical protein